MIDTFGLYHPNLSHPTAHVHSEGSGSPEGVVTKNPGATYYDRDAGQLYTKQTGTGNTGWVANYNP